MTWFDLLPRVAGARAGVGVEIGSRHGNRLRAGPVRIEVRVAERHGDVKFFARARGREVDVVIDELPPGICHGRQLPTADDFLALLVVDDIADLAALGRLLPAGVEMPSPY